MKKSRMGFQQILSQGRGAITALWILGLASVGLSLVLPTQVGRLTGLFEGQQQVMWAPVLRAVIYIIVAQIALSAISFFNTRTDWSLRESMVGKFTIEVFGRILRFGADFFREQEVETD